MLNTVNKILSNFKPEMDFYFTTSARPFLSSEITWYNTMSYYMDNGVLPETKTLVELICLYYIWDQMRENFPPFSLLLF
jgi:hypothetical protein